MEEHEHHHHSEEAIMMKSHSDISLEDEISAKQPETCTPISCLVGSILCCGMGIFSCFTLAPNEHAVLLDYGKYNGTVTEPGCHFVSCAGRTIKTVSTKVKSIVVPETKTIDKNGNPLIINGVLTYQVKNAKRATLDVEAVDAYVSMQSLASLKQIVARYPYEAESGLCLRSSADAISHEMVAILQERLTIAGIKILGFTFNEISYSPEIAGAMLRRQQAHAILQARKLIVTGAVDIAQLAIRELDTNGIAMSDADKARVASNLLTVICSDSSAAPVVPL
eukprot:TRINITY_DN3751_c0_g1_i1.p1 TRINITY_DN3751_c0_g1~~TRINITY_DN3751_c0_g1_i1.p1  ORF type:complete len:280 (-),score=59.87 TRINITY_DN3751_c0_g1_i1:13-852(-)